MHPHVSGVLLVAAVAAAFSLSSAQDPKTVPIRRLPARAVVQDPAELEKRVATLEQQLAALRAVLQVQQSGNKKSLVISADDFKVTASRDVTLEAGDDMLIKAKGDTGCDVDGDFSVKSRKLQLESQTDVAVKAGTVAGISANARLDLLGAQIVLNNGKRGIARQGDPISGGKIVVGSTTIMVQ